MRNRKHKESKWPKGTEMAHDRVETSAQAVLSQFRTKQFNCLRGGAFPKALMSNAYTEPKTGESPFVLISAGYSIEHFTR